MPLGAELLIALWIFWILVGVLVRLLPVLRRGRVVVLKRPRPGSLAQAQAALDRLVAAGIDAEIVEGEDAGINMWANVRVAGEVRPAECYVIQVPRKQAKAASQL